MSAGPKFTLPPGRRAEVFSRHVEVVYRVEAGEPQRVVAREVGLSRSAVQAVLRRVRGDARLRAAVERRKSGRPPWEP